MLTDAKLKSIRPEERAYKLADRDGLYVLVSIVSHDVVYEDFAGAGV